MAKKAKARRRRPTSYMMVIRVRVPTRLIKEDMRIFNVMGVTPKRRWLHSLQVLNAHYDMKGAPSVGID